jgi:hypothetical protein
MVVMTTDRRFTVRLPEELAQEARRFASRGGIALNALVAIALREYLDARPVRAPGLMEVSASSPSAAGPVTLPVLGGNREQRRAAKKGR